MNIVVLITAKNKREANKISKSLLDDKLIACANVIDGIDSLFWWKGKVCREKEVLLVIKSTKSKFKKIVSAVKNIHSYDVPEIIALPIIDGNPDYLKWIKDSTK